MPRTHIVQIAVSIPRQHIDALNAQARKLRHKNAAAWARKLLADASKLDLNKSTARVSLIAEIQEMIERGKRIEVKQEDN